MIFGVSFESAVRRLGDGYSHRVNGSSWLVVNRGGSLMLFNLRGPGPSDAIGVIAPSCRARKGVIAPSCRARKGYLLAFPDRALGFVASLVGH